MKGNKFCSSISMDSNNWRDRIRLFLLRVPNLGKYMKYWQMRSCHQILHTVRYKIKLIIEHIKLSKSAWPASVLKAGLKYFSRLSISLNDKLSIISYYFDRIASYGRLAFHLLYLPLWRVCEAHKIGCSKKLLWLELIWDVNQLFTEFCRHICGIFCSNRVKSGRLKYSHR